MLYISRHKPIDQSNKKISSQNFCPQTAGHQVCLKDKFRLGKNHKIMYSKIHPKNLMNFHYQSCIRGNNSLLKEGDGARNFNYVSF